MDYPTYKSPELCDIMEQVDSVAATLGAIAAGEEDGDKRRALNFMAAILEQAVKDIHSHCWGRTEESAP